MPLQKITQYPEFEFPKGFDKRAQDEMVVKGWVGPIKVRLEDGNQYSIFFIDPTRLEQDLSYDSKRGIPCFAEPGLIVIPKVTMENIKASVDYLWKDGFFTQLKPVDC